MCFRLLLLLALLLFAAPVQAQGRDTRMPPQALFLEALTRAFLDDHEGAISRYREVLERELGQPTVLSALAESYAATGQAALAQETADEAVERDPNNPHFALAAARIAADRGDLSGAMARYEALLAAHPDQPQALDALAALHTRRGTYAEAAALLERLPPSPDALIRRLDLYERLGDDAAFLRTYDQLASVQPPDAALWQRLGAHHLRHGRRDEARVAFESALMRDPASPEVRAALAELGAAVPSAAPSSGLAAYATGDFAEAARLLQASLDLDARDPDVWGQAAMAHLEAGQMDAAARVIEDGRIIFFDYPPLLVAAAYEALARGDVDGAEAVIAEARAALDVPPGAPPAHRTAVALAEAYVLRAQASAEISPEALEALQAQALAPSATGALADLLGAL